MKTINNLRGIAGVFIAIFALCIFLLPDVAEARRGGSFGGSRGGSFRGSRSSGGLFKSSPSRSSSNKSFGGTSTRKSGSSFGGTRSMTKQQAQAKYGTPRKVQNGTFRDANGRMSNYRMNDYGGYSSGLMHGYMMGMTPWYWSMPLHPAFFYSRPTYIYNADGTYDVYPPTFSFMKLLLTLVIVAAIIFIIRAIIKSRRRGSLNRSSFS